MDRLGAWPYILHLGLGPLKEVDKRDFQSEATMDLLMYCGQAGPPMGLSFLVLNLPKALR